MNANPTVRISVNLIKFDGFRSSQQDLVTKTICERLEANGFPGGTVRFNFSKLTKEKSRLPGLYWKRTSVPSEEILVIVEEESNIGFVGYLMPEKSAKDAMAGDPEKRVFKDYLKQPVLVLAPKAGPGTHLITEASVFEGVDDLSFRPRPSDVEERATVPTPKAEPVASPLVQAKGPEQQKPSDKPEDRIPYGTNECLSAPFLDVILGLFLEHWKRLDDAQRQKGVLPAVLTAAFESSPQREAGKKLAFQTMGKVLTKLSAEGLLQKVRVNTVTNVYYPSDYAVGEKPAKRFRGPNKTRGKKPTVGKIEPLPEKGFALNAETIRRVLKDEVEVSDLLKKHEIKLAECEREQKELEVEQTTLRERLKTVTDRLSELKSRHKDLGKEGQNLVSRQEALRPLIVEIGELRKALG